MGNLPLICPARQLYLSETGRRRAHLRSAEVFQANRD